MSHSLYSVVVSLLALFSCLSSLPPLIVHIKGKNFATTVLILGVAILNLQNSVNALIWPSDETQLWWQGKIFCDIEVKLYLGLSVAADGALACIFRHMANIFDTERTSALVPSRRETRARLATDLCLCILLPTCVMAAHYLVQQTRYYIRPMSGCTLSVDRSWPTVLIIYMWPSLLCLTATVCCIIATARLWRHRKDMSAVLADVNMVVTRRRRGDVRLFALASAVLISYLPLTLAAFIETLTVPMHEYSWSGIHHPGWKDDIRFQVDGMQPSFDRWAQIVTGYIVFGFAGFGHDAKQMYRPWLVWLKCRFGKHSHRNKRTGRDSPSFTPNGSSTLEHGMHPNVTEEPK